VNRRALLALLGSSALGCRHGARTSGGAHRLVSLSPGITDALFEIGAGPSVVARSDYCDYPPEVTRLPRVGTSLTPAYETITRLQPTLIIGEAGANARKRELEAIGPTLLLPWLTLEEIVASLRMLGRLTDTAPAADALAAKLHARLAVAPPPSGPRVLLVIGYVPGKLDEIWFIRENSLHGAALHAAGARNAVAEAVTGLPRLSVERLFALDPDAIFVLTQSGHASGDYLGPWKALTPLRAVRDGNVTVIDAPEAYVHGPRILALVERLAAAVAKVRGAR
jgi:ABC-type Fe3+-hydroxamate transport system substrate-binding protein